MFDWIRSQIAKVWNTGFRRPSAWLMDAFTRKSDSGVSVNASTAISYAPVWYAVKKISGHIVQMPLEPYRRVEGGGEKDRTHPAYRLLKARPNPYQSAAVFMETLVTHALLWGNGKAAVIRNGVGQPIELLLIPPDRSMTCYVAGEKFHMVDLDSDNRIAAIGGTVETDRVGDKKYVLPDADVLHIPGLSLDGTSGLVLFEVGKNSIGLGLAAEKASNKDFANAGRPGLLLEAPPGVLRDDKDAKEYIDAFNTFHMGLDNHGKTGLLREGIKASTIPNGSEASNWVEQRRFQRQEIALLFGLEQILGDDSSVSYNSLEQKTMAYLSNCLMPWLVKIEQEFGEKLLSSRQKLRDTHYFRFNTAVLLRSDYKTTIEALSTAIRTRIISPNEARAKIDMLPYEGGDEYQNPAIYIPENEEGVQEEVTPEDANHAAIVAHLRHMVGVEAKQVLAAAGNKRNYIGWIEAFYSDDKWCRTMRRSVVDMGGIEEAATLHCVQSKNALIELAGTVTPDGLADAVAELVEHWPERADVLAQSISKGEPTNV